MPMIEVKLYDHRVTDESVPKMIEALTDALHESSGAAKEHIHVVIQGVPPNHGGIAGKPHRPQSLGRTSWMATPLFPFLVRRAHGCAPPTVPSRMASPASIL